MRAPFLRTAAALALSTAVFSLARAQSGSLYVDAQSNIFGYGVGTPQPGGGGGGLVAPSITLSPGATTVTFSANGIAGWGGSLNNGPDGGTFASSTTIPSVGPISGFTAPLSGELVGLFIPAGDFSGLAAPAGISYPDTSAFTLASYAPGLRQVFYIGDGLTGTGSGSTQTFAVPAGASKLVLGIADAYSFDDPAGYYNDDVGGYNVSYIAPMPTPEPATFAAIGLGTVAMLRRRKRA